jgi:predicted O-linked N-acetylglucosamine transferase (SPINDLY family)
MTDMALAERKRALLAEGTREHEAGRLTAAQAAYREVLRLDPDDPQALHLLGLLAAQCGHNDAALGLFERALRHDPDNARLWHSLGQAERHRGALPAAFAAYNKALTLNLALFEAYDDAAVAAEDEAERMARTGRDKAARELRVLAAHYLTGLGRALWERGRFSAAEPPLRRAVALDPKNAIVWNTLGAALLGMGRVSDAEAAFRRALALDPRFADACNNLGNALADQGREKDAEIAYRRALVLRPDFFAAEQNLNRWAAFNLCYRADLDPPAVFAAHRDWGRTAMARVAGEPAPILANTRNPDRLLRLGFVSPDFRQHSVAYFLEPLLEALDRSRFASIAYAEVAVPDAVTDRLRGLCAEWRSTVGLSDAEVARQVVADRIDILIDLAGHTERSRLTAFASKPAPVTMTWLGYPTTTGLPTIDWRLTDAIADPPGLGDDLHTERLYRLPGGFLCYRAPEQAPAVAPLPALARGHVTFGSFNNLAKVTPAVVERWAAILQRMPGSRLLLKEKRVVDPMFRQRYIDRFAAHGIGEEQLEFMGQIVGTAGHLDAYGRIDVALDPFPYNGTTTSCEALWMGVPVVTMLGDRHSGRVGASLLAHLDLPELVASTPDGYIDAAVALASDIGALAELRRALRGRMAASPLCDAAGFARRFEAALREMWRAWCEGGVAGWFRRRRPRPRPEIFRCGCLTGQGGVISIPAP